MAMADPTSRDADLILAGLHLRLGALALARAEESLEPDPGVEGSFEPEPEPAASGPAFEPVPTPSP